jgi:hypothetical protein
MLLDAQDVASQQCSRSKPNLGIPGKDQLAIVWQDPQPYPCTGAVSMAGVGEGQPDVQSGKNNVMRVLVRRVLQATFTPAPNQRAGDRMALRHTGVGLLNRTYDQRADGGAGTFRATSQLLMQQFWKIDGSTNCHAMIVA